MSDTNLQRSSSLMERQPKATHHPLCWICENVGSRVDQLIRQFVQSMKKNAFEWYTNLELEVIDSQKQLERESMNQLYCTKHTISMMKFTNTKQPKGESIIHYINYWRALSLNCKDRLIIIMFDVEMCTQDMYFGLLYILQKIKLCTFEEMTTCAHVVELRIVNIGTKNFFFFFKKIRW